MYIALLRCAAGRSGAPLAHASSLMMPQVLGQQYGALERLRQAREVSSEHLYEHSGEKDRKVVPLNSDSGSSLNLAWGPL